MQCYLRKDHNDLQDPTDTVFYGPSTGNQVSVMNKLVFTFYFSKTSFGGPTI